MCSPKYFATLYELKCFLIICSPPALFVLYPYLTIHMRELGINVEETAIMSAVTPIVAIIMPPLAGMIADRIGNFRVRAIKLNKLTT